MYDNDSNIRIGRMTPLAFFAFTKRFNAAKATSHVVKGVSEVYPGKFQFESTGKLTSPLPRVIPISAPHTSLLYFNTQTPPRPPSLIIPSPT